MPAHDVGTFGDMEVVGYLFDELEGSGRMPLQGSSRSWYLRIAEEMKAMQLLLWTKSL